MRGKLQDPERAHHPVPRPSMRPALYARETAPSTFGRSWFACTFNEARALCAGSCDPYAREILGFPPSMRPALYAREATRFCCWLVQPTSLQ